MGLWTLLEGFLLLANALAILNEDRFLGPRGWSMSEVSGNGQTKSLKGQIVGLIYATQFLRMPLIALNVLIIVVKLGLSDIQIFSLQVPFLMEILPTMVMPYVRP
uniref:Yos1-like protein n=2 Tax=Oryza TaxID=4527 RepID=A0A0E0QPV1_ORYRU